jgi:hypothetical protein
MLNDILKKLEEEAGEWRTTLDTLKVRANLGKMELRDKADEVSKTFEKAYGGAKERLEVLRREGGDQLAAGVRGMEAAWDELRKTYKDVRKDQKDQKGE